MRAGISWPELQMLVGRDRMGSGVALLIGPEPDYRWRQFTGEVVKVARDLDVRLVVSLGAFPNATPHTRPIKLAATASDAELARKIGVVRGAIEVPAGLGEVIGEACVAAGIPSIGLWARVPHYVAAMPFTPPRSRSSRDCHRYPGSCSGPTGSRAAPRKPAARLTS